MNVDRRAALRNSLNYEYNTVDNNNVESSSMVDNIRRMGQYRDNNIFRTIPRDTSRDRPNRKNNLHTSPNVRLVSKTRDHNKDHTRDRNNKVEYRHKYLFEIQRQLEYYLNNRNLHRRKLAQVLRFADWRISSEYNN